MYNSDSTKQALTEYYKIYFLNDFPHVVGPIVELAGRKGTPERPDDSGKLVIDTI